MEEEGGGHRSHLFTVRVWQEEVDRGRLEWRGRVEHVTSGERRYFRNWPSLVATFEDFLPQPGPAGGEDDAQRP